MWLTLVLLLLACPKSDTGAPPPADADADGFTADEDCDDHDPAVYPGAPETCNDQDDDCDAAVDEDVATSWFPDGDGDGWGSVSQTLTSCAPPSGWVDNASDCDDADATVYPGATETCDGRDQDCDNQVDEGLGSLWHADGDGDGWGDGATSTTACDAPPGWVEDDTDCDDADATVYPGAMETCDGVDQDCDSEVDEGVLSAWYTDADADGYGAGEAVQACEAPAGTVADDTDCNDRHGGIFPGAEEVCDTRDNDCDSEVDEGLATPWYLDADRDGSGDPATETWSCAPPDGTVSDGTDCDDADPLASPWGWEECDGVDNDCDGATDEGLTRAWYADTDGDGYGAGDPVEACAAPSGTVAGDDDCDDASADTWPGAPETCDGVDRDCDGWVVECETDASTATATVWGGADGILLGTHLASTGDATGDGVPDLAAAAYGEYNDTVYLLDGSLLVDGGPVADLQAASLRGPWSSQLGRTLGGVGDVDGDGMADLVAGSTEKFTSEGGAAYLLLGPVSGAWLAMDADGVLRSPEDMTGLASSLAPAGDQDGDGGDEIWVGASEVPGYLLGSEAWLAGDLELAVAVLDPPEEGVTGLSGDGGQDLDGDGVPDLVYGDWAFSSRQGAAWIHHGPVLGTVAATDADAVILGTGTLEELGRDVVLIPDWDGDGLGEVAVSADSDQVFVFPGSAAGSMSDTGARATVTSGGGWRAGWQLASGDVDGDGLGDLVVGGEQDDGGVEEGFTLLVGPLEGAVSLATLGYRVAPASPGTWFGHDVATLPDLDGDGGREVAVGAPWGTRDLDKEGSVYLFVGIP